MLYCLTCRVRVRPDHEPTHRTVKAPGLRALERYMDDGIARTPDGCRTEPDGNCPHGHRSWMLVLGVI